MTTEDRTLSQNTGINWMHWLVVALGLGILAFLISPNAPLGGFWGVPAERAMPVGTQKLLVVLLGAIQSLALGFGIAFLLYGFSLAKARIPAHPGRARAAHLAIAWSLISWWPHSSLHQTLRADDLGGLLAVEYAFHATLILAGLIMVFFFMATLRQEDMPSRRT